jgi:hypothetical protein
MPAPESYDAPMRAAGNFVKGFVLVWIVLIVIGLMIVGAEHGTLHRAPEMVQKEQAWRAAGEQADAEAAAIERRASLEAKVPPK